ncbi:zona pellucida sperm-binding protein 3-like [Erpetoichthys calabaricus]|uniref:Zona pellucida sperm-binding protein 3 n=1 Tax=Erpetoichthys calabaricus TaxID=27687 RepID=A0A8C4SC01_ERPCA|nr:zona pellucida sperm-binding protein 3-like [Erpetoichthys calabaricus]
MGSRQADWALAHVFILMLCVFDSIGWAQQLPKHKLSWPEFKSMEQRNIFDYVEPRVQGPAQSISLSCETGHLVVTVDLDIFSNGIMAKSSELNVGSSDCQSQLKEQFGNVLNISLMLQDCGNIFQVFPDYISYSNVLHYVPDESGIVSRTNPIDVQLECQYPRTWNVSNEGPLLPTWMPFSSTAAIAQSFSFSLVVMNADWSGPKITQSVFLGDPINLEATVLVDSKMQLRLYIDSCIATLNGDVTSRPSYAVVDKFGCLEDGKTSDSPVPFMRPALDKLRMTISAFQFRHYPSSTIYLTCLLRAVPASKPADATNKACSYQTSSNMWVNEDGSSTVCSCCNEPSCPWTPAPARSRQWIKAPMQRWSGSKGRMRQKKEAPYPDSGADSHMQRITVGPLTVNDLENYSNQALTNSGKETNSLPPILISALALVVIAAVLAFLHLSRQSSKQIAVIY